MNIPDLDRVLEETEKKTKKKKKGKKKKKEEEESAPPIVPTTQHTAPDVGKHQCKFNEVDIDISPFTDKTNEFCRECLMPKRSSHPAHNSTHS